MQNLPIFFDPDRTIVIILAVKTLPTTVPSLTFSCVVTVLMAPHGEITTRGYRRPRNIILDRDVTRCSV